MKKLAWIENREADTELLNSTAMKMKKGEQNCFGVKIAGVPVS